MAPQRDTSTFADRIASVILAAGRSSRMGSPKALIYLQGKTFLGRIIETHKQAGLPICVVLGENRRQIERLTNLSEVVVVINPRPEKGQLSSLHTALQLVEDSSALLMHPVDHPLVKIETVLLLVQAHQHFEESILIPEFRGRTGHPILFSRRFYPDLRQAPLNQGARWVVRQNPEAIIQVPVQDQEILRNINRPRDLPRHN